MSTFKKGEIMEPSFEALKDALKKKNIRLSYQRIKVIEYLTKHTGQHPTVDQIYSVLLPEIPTLSKTTVYNTLNSLTEADLVRAFSIEDTGTRYDIHTENHGHFKCDSCGMIYDFSFDTEALRASELAGFSIRERSLNYKGTCPDCLINKINHI